MSNWKNELRNEVIQKTYNEGKNRHPQSCYGEWTWIQGTLKARCQGCGYTMKINPKNKQLEHLDSATEATRHSLAVRELSQRDHDG